jgi:hypothetical protein
MRAFFLVVISALALSGCAVSYTPAKQSTNAFDEPAIGTITTAQIGDHLLRKGLIVEGEVLSLKSKASGFAYDILPGEYPQLGYTDTEKFFLPAGIIKNPLADPYQGMSVKNEDLTKVCVITVFGVRACYDAKFEIVKRATERDASFQQTLIYSGRIGSKINIGYREFSNNSARPAFNNDVEYDLSASKVIGYKGAQIEVIDANNSEITYKVIKSFK